jgi:hypothetical protein
MPIKTIRAVWVVLSVMVLVVSLYRFDGKPNSDIEVFLAWSMLVLSFPSSLLIALLLSGTAIVAEALFSTVIPSHYWSIFISWICFFVVGYWQWFVLLPWLWRKWRTRRLVRSNGTT